MGDPHEARAASGVTFEEDDHLYLGSRSSELAHHALGRMLAAASLDELTAATEDFLASSRSAVRSITELLRSARTRPTGLPPRLEQQLSGLTRHPLRNVFDSELRLYVAPLARGSSPAMAGMTFRDVAMTPTMADEVFFENLDKQPVLAMCVEYLERVDDLIDQTRRALASI